MRCLTCFIVLASCVQCSAFDDFPEPVNTQAAGEHPPSPREMLDLIELPEGFKVTLFAGEPDVQQPIAFDFDDRGRIWVAENYTYSAHGKTDPNLRDRVIILHDKDGDGEHDERKVFWDKGRMLTGLTWGFGGLWILNDGTLSFIPDKNGDDVPDGEPVVMLNGWTKNAGHNFVNGLLWGPDGWLYGRHGITDTSYPGTPDTPVAERQPINCGIWRFHPVTHTFEVVCHGTTNPWGLDYNEYGDMFMTNNVIGHLWHVIPGAHYERMFGQDFNPHCYELMGQCADHYHWDNTGKWSDSRDGKAADLGGGHSHCGGMIYHGQNFPEEYRGRIFMCNTHGRCVNVNRLERKGSTYVGKREPDFLKVNTPWFRGVELKYGPRGCVYLTDWSDNGECHDHDGVHRTSGRIYRISYGEPESDFDEPSFASSADGLLSATGVSSSEWTRRRAGRLFVEAYPGCNDAEKNLIKQLCDFSVTDAPGQANAVLVRARLMGAAGVLNSSDVTRLIMSSNEHLRAFGIRYAAENGTFYSELRAVITSWLQHETSPIVLREYASALQRSSFKPSEGTGIETCIDLMLNPQLISLVDADKTLQLLTWYGFERAADKYSFMFETANVSVAKVRNFRMRRLATNWDKNGKRIGWILSQWVTRMEPANGTSPLSLSLLQLSNTRDLLQAMLDGMEGQVDLNAPAEWDTVSEQLTTVGNEELNELISRVSAAFGTEAGIEKLYELISDRSGNHVGRANAISTLASLGRKDSVVALLPLLSDRAVYVDVCKALAAFDDPRIPQELLKKWDSLRHGAKEAATDTLCSRQSYGIELANAVDDGRVTSDQLTASQVRQLLSFNDSTITKIIESKWGVINDSSEAKVAAIAKWKQDLTSGVLAKADLENGAALFKKSCANCHRLYGDGGKIGPDLTGGNRANMDYLLGNVLDPSAEVPKQFTTSVIALTSGRIITGVVVGESETTLTVQTDKELMKIAVAEIEEKNRTSKSLMPDGLLDSLSRDQVRDLIAFVQQRR